MRYVLLVIVLFGLASLAEPLLFRGPTQRVRSDLAAVPVTLGAERVGALRFIDGWALSSSDPRFGGISALSVAGGRVQGVSDAGWLIDLAVPGTPGAGTVDINLLPAVPGDPVIKSNRDAEAMVRSGDTFWVAFEQANAIFRYRADQSVQATYPRAMRHWPANVGPEAMIRLPHGRFLILSEDGKRADGSTDVLLFDGDPADDATGSVPLRYHPPKGFRITDAALLPDGRLLTLNRRYRFGQGVRVKLVLAALPRLAAGTRIIGEEIAELRAPLTVDNFEGLAVTQERGRTIVWLASDDNYNPLQRTLLMRFVLEPAGLRPRSPAASSRSRASAAAP